MILDPKVGDRVRLRGHGNIGGESIVVEGLKAEVTGESTCDRLSVKLLRNDSLGDYECDVFPSQCRRLKPNKRREWWINESYIREDRSMALTPLSWKNLFTVPDGRYIRTTPPEDKTGWICVREVKK